MFLLSIITGLPLSGFSLKYLLTTESGESRFMIWDIEKAGDKLTMISYDYRGTRTFISDTNGSISQFFYEDFDSNIYFEGNMTGNRVSVYSRESRRENRTFNADNPFWYQPLGFCFFDFARSDEEERDLFTVNPENLKEVNFTLRKQEEETITILEKEYDSVKAELRLQGILAPIWSGTYWLNPQNGLLLRYRGTFGPGTENTIMELIEIQGQVLF